MKYAICNETFVDWPHERAFAFARECGYTGIEIAPFTLNGDARLITAEQRAEVRQLAADHELEVVGLHWLLAKTTGFHLTTPDADVRQATSQYLGELARLCRDVGGKVLVLGSPQQRNVDPGIAMSDAMAFAAETIRAAVPVLEETDTVLAIEPLGPAEGNFLNHASDGVELMRLIDSANVRLHLDVKAMSSEGIPIPDIIRSCRDEMVHFHANDANKLGPGFGEIDFVPIMAVLKEIGYDGWVSVEVFDYSPGIERLAKESIDYLKECWAHV
ncbi:MAG: sugar phosphate isomerase/epimerase family protein [Pirellulales bacterium]